MRRRCESYNVLEYRRSGRLGHLACRRHQPRKTGGFVLGSGQEIVEPNSLTELHPDAIILMNEIYRHEIASGIAVLGLNPEFWFLKR